MDTRMGKTIAGIEGTKAHTVEAGEAGSGTDPEKTLVILNDN